MTVIKIFQLNVSQNSWCGIHVDLSLCWDEAGVGLDPAEAKKNQQLDDNGQSEQQCWWSGWEAATLTWEETSFGLKARWQGGSEPGLV